jgi:hypothetical protein
MQRIYTTDTCRLQAAGLAVKGGFMSHKMFDCKPTFSSASMKEWQEPMKFARWHPKFIERNCLLRTMVLQVVDQSQIEYYGGAFPSCRQIRIRLKPQRVAKEEGCIERIRSNITAKLSSSGWDV